MILNGLVKVQDFNVKKIKLLIKSDIDTLIVNGSIVHIM